jgi:hypothetical protein
MAVEIGGELMLLLICRQGYTAWAVFQLESRRKCRTGRFDEMHSNRRGNGREDTSNLRAVGFAFTPAPSNAGGAGIHTDSLGSCSMGVWVWEWI